MPTLLLADDSVTIQRVIELTFADEDIQVVAVSDGDQAVRALEEAPPPDIVLADVGMPGRTGYDVAQYIRDNPRLAHIPVLLLTGAFEPVDQAQAAAVGCDGVLAKPFEPQFLVGRVKELLAGPREAEAATSGAAPAPYEASPVSTPVAEYFDRLDEAFSGLGAPSLVAEDPGRATPRFEAAPDEGLPAAEPSLTSEFAPWGPDLLRDGPPAHGDEMPYSDWDAEPVASAEPAADVHAMPPIGDAFEALLAAEQTASTDPAPWAVPPSTGPAASDAAIEEISRRVIEHLTDRVIRDTVREIVSEIAERLVRGEIEKIKNAIE